MRFIQRLLADRTHGTICRLDHFEPLFDGIHFFLEALVLRPEFSLFTQTMFPLVLGFISLGSALFKPLKLDVYLVQFRLKRLALCNSLLRFADTVQRDAHLSLKFSALAIELAL